MAATKPFPLNAPIGATALRNLRLHLRKYAPSAGLGPHLRRRMGQSLEFREYRDYSFGEDIRSVDWAASARKGGKWDLVAKSFEAEERRTLIVLLDCRPAMRLPVSVPKLGVAAWITACLLQVALAELDRVFVAPVFGGDGRAIRIEGSAGFACMQTMVRDALDAALTNDDWQAVPKAQLSDVERHLRPAAAVVFVTDALGDDPDGALAGFVRRAQKGFRSFHVVEIDSWPHERALLKAQPFRLRALAGKSFGETMFDAPEAYLAQVEARLAERRVTFRARWGGQGMIWPDEPIRYPADAGFDAGSARAWFRTALPENRAWRALMSRSG
ncbi:DUF58 domain-containing protein [Roseovarius pelagicus]|uniref:DUF58 domain-containing protein n=1 Tax=Roseovarius pelagicus TaxID=2980108 RepID=A0ABY6DCC2_9RHOB|nr:DUF58 domain-containing protein [Roseovarius pelagicus]UXX83804.1 DUF58 domain-containing protein [Roseovarius pelagicus]